MVPVPRQAAQHAARQVALAHPVADVVPKTPLPRATRTQERTLKTVTYSMYSCHITSVFPSCLPS